MRKILILGMTLMLIMGCNTNQLLPNIQDTPEIISINLEENPTTGYLWSYTAEPADIFKEVGCEFKEPQSNGLVGTSGVRIFTFEPIKDGEVTLTFNYSRSWETKAPVKVCTVSYSVTDGKANVIKELEEKEPAPVLTEETAEKFIFEVLSTLTVHENDTATFTLPENIPADTEDDTALMITMNVKSVVEAGVYSSKRFLDNEKDWSGGEIFVADLKECEGRAEQIMLRVAFMTEVEENAYREYKADHVYLTAPFEYGKLASPNEGLSFTQTFGNLHAIYTTAEGREFEFNLYLPDEIEAKSSDGENEILLMKNGEEIGVLATMMYAATDAETLEAVRKSAEPRPMAVYSSAILSNTVEWPPVDPSEIYHTGKTITTVNHPMVDDEVIFDCVLAYNIDSEPYFVYLNFKLGALTAEEISGMAGSIVIPPKGGIYSIAAEGIGDEFAPDQGQMPTEHDWAGEAERKYYQNVIDTLDFSKLNTFVAKSVPSDEITSAKLTYEQTKTFFDLLKSIKLTTMEPENPATGGGFDVYIVTEDDQLTFSYNGNWFCVSQLGQDKWWIFDGKCASEQFDKMRSEVWEIIHNDISQTTGPNIPLDSTPEWITMQNEALNENLLKIEEMRQEVLDMINEKIRSHRDGTFTEMPNHHAPWREDFPPPTDVKYPLTHSDFAVIPTFYERIDENSYVEGEIKIWVKLSDQGHYMVLKPAWFGVMGTNEPVLGISDSGFYSGELKFDFDSHSKRTPDT